MQHPADQIVAEVRSLFGAKAAARYRGEPVSQLEHALQTATFAELAGASSALVVAALLHDIGHLLHAVPADVATQGVDDCHEMHGSLWLESRFGPAVVEPVAMHVAMKRYLCATDPDYHAQLCPASQRSLLAQGGPMPRDESLEFERRPHFAAARRLRLWDDAAKIVGMETPPLDYFAVYVRCVAAA